MLPWIGCAQLLQNVRGWMGLNMISTWMKNARYKDNAVLPATDQQSTADVRDTHRH